MDATEQLRIAARRARERKNMRQEDVAAELKQIGVDITSNAYAKFEGGARAGKFDEVAAIAQVLELDLTAITRSVQRDVMPLIVSNAEQRYRSAEQMLERARAEFTEAAQGMSATQDLKRAVDGEAVESVLTASEFARITLLDLAVEMPDDVVAFFESLGDEGEVHSAIEQYQLSPKSELKWSGNRMHHGGRAGLLEALSDALARVLPNLKFANG